MRRDWNSTSWVFLFTWIAACPIPAIASPPLVSLQEDGSLVIAAAKGSISDFVKQGTPRQSVQIGDQSCNVSYSPNSAGKKIILISVPANAANPAVFDLAKNRVVVPAKSALRITLGADNQVEKMDGNPPESVQFTPIPSGSVSAVSPDPPPLASASSPAPSQSSPVPSASISPEAVPMEEKIIAAETSSTSPQSPTSASSPPASETVPLAMEEEPLFPSGWPGKRLEAPIPQSQMEEDQFYVRTEFGPRFVSAMNLVSVAGPNGNYGILNQKEIAFSTGYRQDLDLGVWLTDWFGLAIETGFALNAVRGNTDGMTVSSTTFWTVPLLAQLCFQYPNDSGWIPYINFGFGGGWTIFKVGGINYTQPGGASIPLPLSGTGNSVNNAYQIAAGVRYRLYEELSITLAYKFYGNSQANVNLDNGVTATLGSPVTNSAEVGVNFSF